MLTLPGAPRLYRMAQDSRWGDTSMGESQWIANMKTQYGGGWRRIVHNKIIASTELINTHQTKDIHGCQDPNALNYNFQATKNCCCKYLVPGCMYPSATNYNASATSDDGSCTYAAISNPLPGCMQSTATNYNASATADDGSCIFPDGTVPPVVPPVPPVGGPDLPVLKLDEEKPFMEKYKYPLIAGGVILLALMFMKDSPTPQATATAPIIIK
tara:strand:- start:1182 stop:1823 length:642 start_codon:yes stop_codon:yes gene_type:complete